MATDILPSCFLQLLEIQIFSPACKVKLHSDERDKEQQIYVKQL